MSKIREFMNIINESVVDPLALNATDQVVEAEAVEEEADELVETEDTLLRDTFSVILPEGMEISRDALHEFFGMFKKAEKWPEGSAGDMTKQQSQGKWVEQRDQVPALDNHPKYEELEDLNDASFESNVYNVSIEHKKWAVAEEMSRDTGIKATAILQYCTRDARRGRDFIARGVSPRRY